MHDGGGAGGIRTLDRALQPYNGLANRRLQPLGHSSVKADMPDAGASRKQRFDAIESVSQIGPSRPSNRGYVNLSSPRVGPASRFARGSESIWAGQCDVVSFTAYRALRFPSVRGAPWMVGWLQQMLVDSARLNCKQVTFRACK